MSERVYWAVSYIILMVLAVVGLITTHDRIFTLMTIMLVIGQSIRSAILDGKD